MRSLTLVVLVLIGTFLSTLTFAVGEAVGEKNRELFGNSDVMRVVGSYLDRGSIHSFLRTNQQCHDLACGSEENYEGRTIHVDGFPLIEARRRLLEKWPGYAEFESQFVTIPKGNLPDGTKVESFEALRYPVTRELWEEMGMEIPEMLSEEWRSCPTCPVTFVSYRVDIQGFIQRLNERTQDLGCTYDLPTDSQLHYQIRADETGKDLDYFSKGVYLQNVSEYVTSCWNSEWKLQPVGRKKLNRFGIELGNVRLFSKSIDFIGDVSIRGAHYMDLPKGSGLRFKCRPYCVDGYTGFSLVRNCKQKIRSHEAGTKRIREI